MIGSMRALHTTLLLLSAGTAIVAHTGHAAACGALGCANVQEVTPRDEYAPLNTEIRVLYFGTLEVSAEAIGCDLDLAQLRLVPSGGEPIDIQGTMHLRPSAAQGWAVAKPPAPLAPHTVYEVQAQLGGGLEACSCEDREWTTLSTFTTLGGEDHVAPEFAGTQALTHGDPQIGAHACGSYDYVPTLPANGFQYAHDEQSSVRYNVYVGGRLEKSFVQHLDDTSGGAELLVDCGSSTLMTTTRLLPNSSVEIRAVDLAGNESAPTEPIDVPDLCYGPIPERIIPGDEPDSEVAPVPDGEVTPATDSEAAPLPDGTPPEPSTEIIATRASSGCGLTHHASHGAGIGAGLLLLTSCLVRRRRAPRRTPLDS